MLHLPHELAVKAVHARAVGCIAVVPSSRCCLQIQAAVVAAVEVQSALEKWTLKPLNSPATLFRSGDRDSDYGWSALSRYPESEFATLFTKRAQSFERRALMANSRARDRPIAPLVQSTQERVYLERQVRRHRIARS